MSDQPKNSDNQQNKKLLTLKELGLTEKPSPGDACSREGAETCSAINLVLICENGEWRRTSKSCPPD